MSRRTRPRRRNLAPGKNPPQSTDPTPDPIDLSSLPTISTLNELLSLDLPLSEPLTALLRARLAQQEEEKLRPVRIACKVTNGPNDFDFHKEFPYVYNYDGTANFRLRFEAAYNGHTQVCYTHVNVHKYRSGKSRDHYNIAGLIQFALPGERFPKVRKFTGHYSTKSHQGAFRIYVDPTDLDALKKPSDFASPT